MISPEFFLDEELAEVSAHARLLYIGTWQICDDINATLPNRPKWIKAQIFPYDSVNIEKLIVELINIKKLLPFMKDNQSFLFIKNFNKHQRVDRPSQIRKYPEYIEGEAGALDEPSTSPRDEVKISISKVKRNNIHVFLSYFNEKSGKNYQVTDDRSDALERRLKKYSMEQVKLAIDALLKSPHHIGKNKSGTWYATPDFLLRNDEMIDRWLNAEVPNKLPVTRKPMIADSII